MSTDTQAPDPSLTVRYSRGGKNNGGEKEESQVEIYEDADTLGHSHTDLASHKVAVKRSRARATVMFLGALYLLIVAGIFMRYILATLGKQNLTTEIEQLNISLTQAHNRNTNLTEERDELQTRYDILSKNYSLLQDELDKTKTMYEGSGQQDCGTSMVQGSAINETNG